MVAAPIDELDVASAPDQEDDPYQVYMLRRPGERASSVVPQLPKQPEMAETRLRYRRIAPEARSGSLGSLGNHFPARFEFPNRRSMLESLTSDDESSSFAVRRNRRDAKPVSKKKKKKRSGRPPLSPPAQLESEAQEEGQGVQEKAKVPPIAILVATPPEELAAPRSASTSSTPLSTSPATPLPESPTNQTKLQLPTNPAATVDAEALHLAAAHELPSVPNMRLELEKEVREEDLVPTSPPLRSPPSPPASAVVGQETAARRSLSPRLLPRKASAPAVPGRSDEPRAAQGEKGVKARRRDSNKARRVESDRGASERRKGSKHSMHTRRTLLVPRLGSGMTEAEDGRPISAPESMSPSLRQNFVLHAEQPVAYSRTNERSEPRPAEKASVKTRKQRRHKRSEIDLRGPSSRLPPTKSKDEAAYRAQPEAASADPVYSRERDLSVSFVQRRCTAEEAATKPLTAIQKLWNALALVRLSGRRSR